MVCTILQLIHLKFEYPDTLQMHVYSLMVRFSDTDKNVYALG